MCRGPSALARGLKKPKYNAIAFTASHPPHGERAGYLSELASPGGAIRNDGAPRYRQALAKWLPVFLEDQIKLNDFGASEYIIENLARNGWTPTLWHARGELYRTRGNQRDLVHAAQFYQNAIALDGNLAASYRGLGLSLFKTGERLLTLTGQNQIQGFLNKVFHPFLESVSGGLSPTNDREL